MNWWPAAVFGWPAVVIAVVLSAVGIIKRRPTILVASAVIIAPLSLYLGGTPSVGWIGFTMPVLLLGAGVAVRNRRIEIAWLLLIPVVAVIAWLAILVVAQYR